MPDDELRQKLKEALEKILPAGDTQSSGTTICERILISRCGAAIDPITDEVGIGFGLNGRRYWCPIDEARDLIIRWADAISTVEKTMVQKP